ncbi:dihydrodipicolinate synthase family protein [Olivibacter sitiensis]|uniref:dihydrodipicolinate synthase family protein n=1 Tax=Olivibacter sitiensis TaxID=376470 RepID=UPI0005691CEC|nr:dihydrodipicolinate synthase family protein [Olivibacter sitiensis]
MNREKGFIPVMLTPFKENGAIDYDGLTHLTEFYLNAGAAGLFANCLSSEMFELSEAERLKVTKYIVDVSAGAVPVVATGTFGGNTVQQADFVKQIYDTGVQAVIVITNMLGEDGVEDAIFESNVYDLLTLTENIPLGFYECPDPFKRVLSAKQLGAFVSTGRVIYHKDTCLDLDAIKAKLKATEGHDAFGLYDAYMAHAVDSLRVGAAGLSCIQGNYFPELIVWLCKNYDVPELHEQVQEAQQFFIDHMDVMHAVYPVVAKYFLQKRGLPISTYTRRDVGNFDSEVRRDIDKLYVDYENLYKRMEIKLVV